jgi:hypothetical protein
MVCRAVAVFLIVLAVSPFTAPFSTCDLAAVNSLQSDSGWVSADKVNEHVAALAPFVSAGAILEQHEQGAFAVVAMTGGGVQVPIRVLRL